MALHFITTVVDVLSKPQFKLPSTSQHLLSSFFTVDEETPPMKHATF